MPRTIATEMDRDGPGLVQSLVMFPLAAAIIVLVSIATALTFAVLKPASAVAQAKIGLVDTKGNVLFLQSANSALDLTRYTGGRARFATSAQVLDVAARSMRGGVTARQLTSTVTAMAATDADAITIEATGSSGGRAAERANAVAAAYEAVSRKDTQTRAARAISNLQQQLDVVRPRLAEETKTRSPLAEADKLLVAALNQRSSEVQLTATLFGSGVSYISRADPLATSGGRGLPKYFAFGFILGVVAACFVTWVLADRRQRAGRAPEDPPDRRVPLARTNGSVLEAYTAGDERVRRPSPRPR